MNTFLRFFYEFISIFFEGFKLMIMGLKNGIIKLINVKEYMKILNSYKGSFEGPEWILVVLVVVILVIFFGGLGLLLFFLIKKIVRIRINKLSAEDLLDEIGDLNNKVDKLMKEKEEIMAMKVSQLGLNPNDTSEINTEDDVLENGEEPKEEELLINKDFRFSRLHSIDLEFGNLKPKDYGNTFTLEELIDNFRCFAASQLKLYYNFDLLRAFFGGLAAGRIIILQGISGTGKTSLAYAWGKFVNVDSCIASVQPSWRDKTELLGYFNEFTKKFNETNVLEKLYSAGFDDNVHTLILDEMNIARVEYYFAEMLSILEMPLKREWIIELVPSSWDSDPKRIMSGKLLLPPNLWYIGTINNDDSTFMVTDKVYDRAMPIDINSKVDAFECREQEAMNINCTYLESLFVKAAEERFISFKNLDKVKLLDDYVIKHFRVAFGNRIMKQMNSFVPVYVACGGTEEAGIDYFIAKKIFRKFDQLNLALISDEIDPFISYLNKEFGKNIMKECIYYLEILKKSI